MQQTPEDEFLSYLRDRLAKSPRGTQTRLAELFGIDRAVITNILAGKRKTTEQEKKVVREFFGDGESRVGELQRRELGGGVLVVVRIGENTWAKRLLSPAAVEPVVIGAVVSEYPIEDQSAYYVEESTPDGEYRRGDYVFTVPFAKYRRTALPDDVLVIKTEEDGFERRTLRWARYGDKGLMLSPLLVEPRFDVATAKDILLEVVIGFYRPQKKIL